MSYHFDYDCVDDDLDLDVIFIEVINKNSDFNEINNKCDETINVNVTQTDPQNAKQVPEEEVANRVSVIKFANSVSGSHTSPQTSTQLNTENINNQSVTQLVFNAISSADQSVVGNNACIIWRAINECGDSGVNDLNAKQKQTKACYSTSDERLAQSILEKWFNDNKINDRSRVKCRLKRNFYYLKKRAKIIKNLSRKANRINKRHKQESLQSTNDPKVAVKSCNQNIENKTIHTELDNSVDIDKQLSSLNNTRYNFRHKRRNNLTVFQPKISTQYATKFNNIMHNYDNTEDSDSDYMIESKENNRYKDNGNNKGPNKDLSKSVYAGLFSAKDVEQYRERYEVNGKYMHRCKWKDCNYENHLTKTLNVHIHVKHIGTKGQQCSVAGCGKTFKYPNTLALHLRYHLCGFKIDTEKYEFGKGLCSKYHINKYYKRVDKYSYRCQWPDCSFSSSSSRSKSIERHVHSQHICPNRVSEKSIHEIFSLLESNSGLKTN